MRTPIHIIIDEYDYDCADGCCTNFGTKVTINGVEMPYHNEDIATILEQVLAHLGFDATVEQTYNGQ